MTLFKHIFTAILMLLFSCRDVKREQIHSLQNDREIVCTDRRCEGAYIGPEFKNGSDVAHQFSNKMAAKVGDQLKLLYNEGKYSKVDFKNIEMTTKGMGSGTVEYSLIISFKTVKDSCQAYTSFDHVGGWNHAPELASRKKQLSQLLLKGENLDISDLKTTPEGLQEYWIQWKNKEVQSKCKQ